VTLFRLQGRMRSARGYLKQKEAGAPVQGAFVL